MLRSSDVNSKIRFLACKSFTFSIVETFQNIDILYKIHLTFIDFHIGVSKHMPAHKFTDRMGYSILKDYSIIAKKCHKKKRKKRIKKFIHPLLKTNCFFRTGLEWRTQKCNFKMMWIYCLNLDRNSEISFRFVLFLFLFHIWQYSYGIQRCMQRFCDANNITINKLP